MDGSRGEKGGLFMAVLAKRKTFELAKTHSSCQGREHANTEHAREHTHCKQTGEKASSSRT